jgi:cell division protein FtsL
MKLAMISILLFCLIFALAVPIKMEGDRLAGLILQETLLEDSISKKRYDLYLLERSIDSLSSRNRIDSIAIQLGLSANEIPTKIMEYAK